jgi:phospholipase C
VASDELFGLRAAGAPFTVYALGSTAKGTVRNYAIQAGQQLGDKWSLAEYPNGRYHLRVYGPNGFFREFAGTAHDPPLETGVEEVRSKSGPATLTGDIFLAITNRDAAKSVTIEVLDHSYGNPTQSRTVASGQEVTVTVESRKSGGWYDFSCRIKEPAGEFIRRYAGRVETGRWSTSDPAIGR